MTIQAPQKKPDTGNDGESYNWDDIRAGVVILDRLPTARTSRNKGRQEFDAANRIINGHPYHEELNALLTRMAGAVRPSRLAAVIVVYREYANPGSVIWGE